jgi:quercetin dioxygenase-like cupin family protein
MPINPQIDFAAAQVVVPCRDLAAALELLTGRLGFRLDEIFPADAPATAALSGHGLTLRLETGDAPARLRLLCDELPPDAPRELIAGGLRVELVESNPPLVVPPCAPEFVLTRHADSWHAGRAGMLYRDLIPGRLGGRFVASHIRIPVGGPVPDYVHFHRVRWQMIYCITGHARLVYEDQGPPFVFRAGDCVLQPPEIRHRVLSASDGFEVVEIGCPALHETCADHDMQLPNGQFSPHRIFNGQRFVHAQADARWQPSDGYEFRDTGIASATDGLAGARVVRLRAPVTRAHAGEFLFYFVLAGKLSLNAQMHGNHRLGPTDSFVIPSGTEFTLAGNGAELLEVILPARR